MAQAKRPDSNRTAGGVIVPLGITLATQSLTAFAMHAASVYAPIAAPGLDMAPERVSVFVMFAYALAMIAGLACPPFITRLGSLRTVQMSLIASGLGLASGAVGSLAIMLVSACLIGFGNGLVGPVSSHILVQRAPRSALSFVLSVKQTGVPIGGGVAGAIIPALALAIGWQPSLVVASVVYLVAALAVQPLRAEYDRERERDRPLSAARMLAQMRASLAFVWSHRRLRDVSIACFAYVTIQWVVLTFMVSLLHVRLGFALVTAGFVFSAAQLTGLPGRLFWGALGDRVRKPLALLGWLGIAMAILTFVIAAWSASWPLEMIFLVSVLFGATGVSWNGLFFAEVARAVRFEDVSRATGGVQFIGFFGGMIGPLLFDAIATSTGRYGLAYVIMGCLPLAAGLLLLVRARGATGV